MVSVPSTLYYREDLYEFIQPKKGKDMLSLAEIAEIESLLKRLNKFKAKNVENALIYDAKNRVKDLGISIPPNLRGVAQATGWARIAVDSLAERIILEGWQDSEEDGYGLNEIFDANYMLTEQSTAHLDAMRYGISFALVSAGNQEEGEPEVLITAESPNVVTARYSLRKRRVVSAIYAEREDKEVFGTFFTETESIPFAVTSGGLIVEDGVRTYHELGRVPVVQIINRRNSSSSLGHSEITQSIKNIINSVMRTLLGAEVAREFYSAPQRYVLGVDPDAFVDSDGNDKNPISVMMDRVTVLEANSQGNNPSVGTFPANSPSAALEMIRMYAQMFSAETAIPQDYLGFNASNPTSAEAMAAAEMRLVSRAEQRIVSFERPWEEVARLAILTRDGSLPEGFRAKPNFREPSTPTKSASADYVTKLVSAGVIQPDSELLFRKLGWSRADVNTVRRENNAAQARNVFASLAALPPGETAPEGA